MHRMRSDDSGEWSTCLISADPVRLRPQLKLIPPNPQICARIALEAVR